jgi:hypothetical protein
LGTTVTRGSSGSRRRFAQLSVMMWMALIYSMLMM